LAAAEAVFKLADHDFKFQYPEDELYATRPWVVYLVLVASIGQDYWLIKTSQTSDGVRVTVQVSESSQATTITTTTGGEFAGALTPLAGAPVDGNALYVIFWARMDYLLGKSNDWPDCKEAKSLVAEAGAWGDIGELCNPFNVDDKMPTPALRQAVMKGSADLPIS